ncbi:isopenicillin N synthase family oxygenase [Shewanella sp. VB17]|uniref:isopenicillin N synthase family dioxygenase n=1 Tax=Shewanella sp. VB17 TaxID=2739432 RepID=UPI0015644BB2|nr:isopenicillin N synthase family oxygenase [Shewanella sp. VB17]NRD71931.1 isopenicillin N synthase family oxygenase [Shewanella sp. VB17]
MLPIVDLTKLADPNECARLQRSLMECGFFFITGHGIDTEKVFTISKQFFLLSEAEKNDISMDNSRHFRGYSHIGSEVTDKQVDVREQFDVGSEDIAVTVNEATQWQGLIGPNQWPKTLPDMQPVLTEFAHKAQSIALEVIKGLAKALSISEQGMLHIYGDKPHQHMKLIRYPDGAQQQGVGAHKDEGLLTLLLQDNVGGLQVKMDNQWQDVPTIPGTIVVNVGELLEMFTAGELQATEHRVQIKANERYSAAFFLGGTLNQIVEPTGNADENFYRSFKSFHIGENYFKGRLRSHPNVANKFYKDIK